MSCARATSVGTCLVTGENGAGAGKKLSGVYYPDGPSPWSEETARADCATLKGTFTR